MESNKYRCDTKVALIKPMDIKKLRAEHPKLLDYIAEKQYSQRYVTNVQNMLNLLFEHEGLYSDYDGFFKKFISEKGMLSNDKYEKPLRIALKTIASFDEEGLYPNKCRISNLFIKKLPYDKLIPEFQQVIDNYISYSNTTEKRETTIHAEAINGAKFLLCMQERGACRLKDIQEHDVLSFFWDGEKKLRGSSYKTNICAVLKGNCKNDTWQECRRLYYLMPSIKDVKKNYPFLTDEELRAINKEVAESKKMSLRDKAIITLLIHTGIRGVDVANLKKSNLDWKADKINIIQSKTMVPLTLPLRATLGNAILNYIDKERPNIPGLEILFVNTHNNMEPLQMRSIGQIVSRILSRIGARNDKGQSGVRLFRHHLATTLLKNGVTTRVISDILGHTSPLSINPYIDADIEHLRECGLSIADYPVGKEVFE